MNRRGAANRDTAIRCDLADCSRSAPGHMLPKSLDTQLKRTDRFY